MSELFDLLSNQAFWIALLRIATPLVFGTLGVLLCERAGVLNLGIEGIMVAGAIEVAGRTSYVTLDMSPGYGYTGIVIAMLAGLHPLGVVAAGVFVAGVLVGADTMSRAVGVPTYIADVIVAASLVSVLVATLLAQYRVRWK